MSLSANPFARGSRHFDNQTSILTGIVKMQFAIGTRWLNSDSSTEFEVIAHELPYFVVMRTATHDAHYSMPNLTSGLLSEITPAPSATIRSAIPKKSRKGAR